MYSHYLDALAIAKEFKKFTLFITMTGNPQWSTVQCNLFEGQKAYDRPDIMNRVFNKMLQDLMTDLKFGVLGPVKAWLYTIEGQLRCLKHAHILILLSIQLDVEDIDNIISAQIPDPEEKPELYECVSKYMDQVILMLPAWRMEYVAKDIQRTFKKKQSYHTMDMDIQSMHDLKMTNSLKKMVLCMITDGWCPIMNSFLSSMIAMSTQSLLEASPLSSTSISMFTKALMFQLLVLKR